LIFKVVLIGYSADIVAQAEELNGFISENLGCGDHGCGTILFCSKKQDKNALLDLVPTESVKLVTVAGYRPETILEALKIVENMEETHLYLFPGGYAGSELAVRWAFRAKGSSLVQVNQIEYTENQLIAKKKVYSDYVMGVFRLKKKPYCIAPARGSASSLPVRVKQPLTVTEHDMTHLYRDRFVKSYKWTPGEKTGNLDKAKFILIGGRGMNNAESAEKLKKIADSLGAAFGVSRPAAMNAWSTMDKIVGVSGAVTKPDVCIVAGASGAAAFYVGIEKSKFIVAINKDPRAPIIKSSDVAIIDDYKAVMDELVKLISAQK
jgi:electron transfer flavoprotein alpha subunit